ncbi:MAG: biotin transporter BioY [Candidatus Thorarchaeota archaeon]
MNNNITSRNYDIGYLKIIQFRRNLSSGSKLLSSLLFACLTGFFTQIKILLPWTPIPITLQTVSVIFSGLLLGSWFGSLSQIFYLTVGIFRIPWFAGSSQGISAFFGPTYGYLIGFIFASFFIGRISGRKRDDSYSLQVFFYQISIIYFIFIYGFGATFLYHWSMIFVRLKLSFCSLLMMSFFPFLLGDISKIIFIFFSMEQFWSKNNF